MDLTFEISENEKFNVRSAALIKYHDNYLISKREDKDYYSIPGGRISFAEDSKEAILRELKEELNWDIAPNAAKLVRIIENFFIYKDNQKFHEYLFVYLIDTPEQYFKQGNFINLENPHMHMEWYKKEDYQNLNIKPEILKDILNDEDFKNLIIKDDVLNN